MDIVLYSDKKMILYNLDTKKRREIQNDCIVAHTIQFSDRKKKIYAIEDAKGITQIVRYDLNLNKEDSIDTVRNGQLIVSGNKAYVVDSYDIYVYDTNPKLKEGTKISTGNMIVSVALKDHNELIFSSNDNNIYGVRTVFNADVGGYAVHKLASVPYTGSLVSCAKDGQHFTTITSSRLLNCWGLDMLDDPVREVGSRAVTRLMLTEACWNNKNELACGIEGGVLLWRLVRKSGSGSGSGSSDYFKMKHSPKFIEWYKNTLAMLSDGNVIIWDPDSGNVLATLGSKIEHFAWKDPEVLDVIEIPQVEKEEEKEEEKEKIELQPFKQQLLEQPKPLVQKRSTKFNTNLKKIPKEDEANGFKWSGNGSEVLIYTDMAEGKEGEYNDEEIFFTSVQNEPKINVIIPYHCYQGTYTLSNNKNDRVVLLDAKLGEYLIVYIKSGNKYYAQHRNCIGLLKSQFDVPFEPKISRHSSVDTQYIAITDHRNVAIYKIDDGIMNVYDFGVRINSIDWDTENLELYMNVSDGDVVYFDPVNVASKSLFKTGVGNIRVSAYTDSKFLCFLSKHEFRIWDLKSGKGLYEQTFKNPLACLMFDIEGTSVSFVELGERCILWSSYPLTEDMTLVNTDPYNFFGFLIDKKNPRIDTFDFQFGSIYNKKFFTMTIDDNDLRTKEVDDMCGAANNYAQVKSKNNDLIICNNS